MNIVEIHTVTGSQYTVITRDDGTVLVNMARHESHPLPEHEVLVVTDWAMRVVQGMLLCEFTTPNGAYVTSRITQVRQQVAGVFV